MLNGKGVNYNASLLHAGTLRITREVKSSASFYFFPRLRQAHEFIADAMRGALKNPELGPPGSTSTSDGVDVRDRPHRQIGGTLDSALR